MTQLAASVSLTEHFDDLLDLVDKERKVRQREIGKAVREKQKTLAGTKGPSRAGQPPGKQSGKYRKAIKFRVPKDGFVVFIGPTWPKRKQPYPTTHILEGGRTAGVSKKGRRYPAMDPRPMLKRSLDESVPEIRRIVLAPYGTF